MARLQSSTMPQRMLHCVISIGSLLLTATGQQASRAEQGSVRLEPVRDITVDGGTTHAAAFAPDGGSLVLGGGNGDLIAWSYPGLKELWRVRPSDHWIGTIAFSADGSTIACLGRHLTMHDAATGRERARTEGTGLRGFCWLGDDASTFAHARGGQLVVRVGQSESVWAEFEYPIRCLARDPAGGIRVGATGRFWHVAAAGAEPELVGASSSDDPWDDVIAAEVAGGVAFSITSKGSVRRGETTRSVDGALFAAAVSSDGGSFAVGGSRGAFTGGARRVGSARRSSSEHRWQHWLSRPMGSRCSRRPTGVRKRSTDAASRRGLFRRPGERSRALS